MTNKDEIKDAVNAPVIPEGKVLVEEAQLTKVLDQIEVITKRSKEQDEELALLREAANKNRLIEAENKKKPAELPRGFLKVYTDADYKRHLIVGWQSSPENRLVINPLTNSPVGEILKAKYFFKDGGDTDFIDQVIFTRINDLAYFRIQEKLDGGYYMIKMEDNDLETEIFKIHSTFINP